MSKIKTAFTIQITFKRYSIFKGAKEKLENITEIHYNYKSITEKRSDRIAFESIIDNTGYTYCIHDIEEFEAIITHTME